MAKPSGFDTCLMSIGAIAIGMPAVAIGIFLCFSIWGIIPGIILMLLGSLPFAIVQMRSVENNVAYKLRDHALDEGEEKPWME